MSGIHPAFGVPAGQTVNATSVATENCPADPLFYSVTACRPQFDPAAMNAMISEMLNLMSCADVPYNCNRLDNLCVAIRTMLGIMPFIENSTYQNGNLVLSTDNIIYWNNTGMPISVGLFGTSAALEALGFTRLNAFAFTASAAGVDSFGFPIAIGDRVIQFTSGLQIVVTDNTYEPCSEPNATPAQVNTLDGSETVSVCIGGQPRRVRIDDLPIEQLCQTPNASAAEINAITAATRMFVCVGGNLRQVTAQDWRRRTSPAPYPEAMAMPNAMLMTANYPVPVSPYLVNSYTIPNDGYDYYLKVEAERTAGAAPLVGRVVGWFELTAGDLITRNIGAVEIRINGVAAGTGAPPTINAGGPTYTGYILGHDHFERTDANGVVIAKPVHGSPSDPAPDSSVIATVYRRTR